MKNYSIIGFIFGVGAGVSAGFYIGKTMTKKKTDEEVEFKVEQIRNYYDSKFEALKNELTKEKMAEDAKTNKEPEGTDATENETTEDTVTENDVKGNEEIIQKCNYSAFSKKDAEEENKEETMSNVVLEPNEITQREFWDYEDEGYRSITATYCLGDGTWFDEDDVPINDITSRVGVENIEMFVDSVEASGIEEERWVRNEMCDEVFHLYILNMTSEEYMKGR